MPEYPKVAYTGPRVSVEHVGRQWGRKGRRMWEVIPGGWLRYFMEGDSRSFPSIYTISDLEQMGGAAGEGVVELPRVGPDDFVVPEGL